MINPTHKKWIDEASYDALLYRWRFAQIGDTMFQGETGNYYAKVMKEKSKSVDTVAASKRIGWNN